MRGRNKNDYVVLIIVALIGITIGYAVINTTLNINGKSSISKNTWNVYFDNIVVKEDSVEAVKIPTIENSTTVDFEVALNLPGDFYEFTIDVVNGGSIDAMIESITKEPELTEAQQKYLNYTITYENDEPITTKQLVKKEELVRLKVKVELRKDINPSDLPDVGDVLYLSFTINYVQADNSGVSVTDNGTLKVKPIANGDINELGTIVTIGTEKFYTIGTEGDNVNLFAMYNLYVGGESVDGNWTAYGSDATGMQDENMIGYISEQSAKKGTTAYFEDIANEENIYNSYSGSIVEKYVNNYKLLLKSKFGLDVVEARLITSEELKNSETLACGVNTCTTSAYPWVYSTSYWTSSEALNIYLYTVESGGFYSVQKYSVKDKYGVRPVIVISKSLF